MDDDLYGDLGLDIGAPPVSSVPVKNNTPKKRTLSTDQSSLLDQDLSPMTPKEKMNGVVPSSIRVGTGPASSSTTPPKDPRLAMRQQQQQQQNQNGTALSTNVNGIQQGQGQGFQDSQISGLSPEDIQMIKSPDDNNPSDGDINLNNSGRDSNSIQDEQQQLPTVKMVPINMDLSPQLEEVEKISKLEKDGLYFKDRLVEEELHHVKIRPVGFQQLPNQKLDLQRYILAHPQVLQGYSGGHQSLGGGKGFNKASMNPNALNRPAVFKQRIQDIRVGPPPQPPVPVDGVVSNKNCVIVANLSSTTGESTIRKKALEIGLGSAGSTGSGSGSNNGVRWIRFLENPRTGCSFGIAVLEFASPNSVKRALQNPQTFNDQKQAKLFSVTAEEYALMSTNLLETVSTDVTGNSTSVKEVVPWLHGGQCQAQLRSVLEKRLFGAEVTVRQQNEWENQIKLIRLAQLRKYQQSQGIIQHPNSIQRGPGAAKRTPRNQQQNQNNQGQSQSGQGQQQQSQQHHVQKESVIPIDLKSLVNKQQAVIKPPPSSQQGGKSPGGKAGTNPTIATASQQAGKNNNSTQPSATVINNQNLTATVRKLSTSDPSAPWHQHESPSPSASNESSNGSGPGQNGGKKKNKKNKNNNSSNNTTTATSAAPSGSYNVTVFGVDDYNTKSWAGPSANVNNVSNVSNVTTSTTHTSSNSGHSTPVSAPPPPYPGPPPPGFHQHYPNHPSPSTMVHHHHHQQQQPVHQQVHHGHPPPSGHVHPGHPPPGHHHPVHHHHQPPSGHPHPPSHHPHQIPHHPGHPPPPHIIQHSQHPGPPPQHHLNLQPGPPQAPAQNLGYGSLGPASSAPAAAQPQKRPREDIPMSLKDMVNKKKMSKS